MTFVRDGKLYITKGKLLNFWQAPFLLLDPHTLQPRMYKGVEWRFQAMKTVHMLPMARTQADAARLHQTIAEAEYARDAKSLGRRVDLDRDAWDTVAYDKMLEAMQAKFQQNEELGQHLVDTGELVLVEHRPDPLWGDNMDGSGQNLCGKALMQVRALLQATTTTGSGS